MKLSDEKLKVFGIYLWNEADERIKRRMDEKLLELFHIEKD